MSAQRASAPVRLARLAAAVVMVAAAALTIARLAGRRGGPQPAAVEPPPEGRVVDLKERVRREEYREGRLVASVRGDSFFRGPDGKNHLKGSVEVVNYGPAGETVSKLAAGEVVYDPEALLFTVTGNVRVEAGGVVLEGGAFDYDKTGGVFATAGGGRFASKTIEGRAPEISYRESAEEVRLGGGFRVSIAASDAAGGPLTVTGGSFVFERRARQGRVEGRVALEGPAFKGEAAAASFVASRDESSLESVVLEGAAKVVLGGGGPRTAAGAEIRADRIAVSFARDPSGFEIRTSGSTSLALRSAADRTETVLAPTALVSFDRLNDRWTWSASGGVRAAIAEAGGRSRALEGAEASFDTEGILGVSGQPGRPAVADSAEIRIEAPKILVASASGEIQASGGVACVLKRGEGRRAAGFFSPDEDVSVSCDRLKIEPGASTSFFAGNVLARQGTDALRAGEIEFSGDTGGMSAAGGAAVTLTEAAADDTAARTIELGGRSIAYAPGARTLTLSSKASVKLPEAGLEAGSVSVVLSRDGRTVETLTAEKGVAVSKGRYAGRAEAAVYKSADRRITLTGRPVLTDDKGGSARGARLTFDLSDDKILIENEGPERGTTIVRS